MSRELRAMLLEMTRKRRTRRRYGRISRSRENHTVRETGDTRDRGTAGECVLFERYNGFQRSPDFA